MDFRYLEAFDAVARTKSFTRAGKMLHIATSAVSRQIQLLEESCGEQLFFRSAREATLTETGRGLYEAVKQFHLASAGALGGKSSQKLSVGTLPGVLQYWLAPRIGSLECLREVNLEIRVAMPQELVRAVEEGEVAAAFFSFVHSTPVPRTLRVVRLFRERIVLISRDKVSFADLHKHRWVCLTPQTWIVRYAKRAPERYILVNQLSAVVELVRAGQGIAMVPEYSVTDRRGLQVRPVEKFSREHICLLWRRYEREPALLREFLAGLRRECPEWKIVQ
jgi:LysR family glycine cleavage system transcriptional activator